MVQVNRGAPRRRVDRDGRRKSDTLIVSCNKCLKGILKLGSVFFAVIRALWSK